MVPKTVCVPPSVAALRTHFILHRRNSCHCCKYRAAVCINLLCVLYGTVRDYCLHPVFPVNTSPRILFIALEGTPTPNRQIDLILRRRQKKGFFIFLLLLLLSHRSDDANLCEYFYVNTEKKKASTIMKTRQVEMNTIGISSTERVEPCSAQL